jgi:carotenoid cleavage oxygenase
MTTKPAASYLNPFSVGAFRPVTGECTAADLPIEGALPPELDGLFARNSFTPFPGKPLPPHLFFADGLLHGLRLQGGQAKWFRNRWVVTEAVAAACGQPAPSGPPDIRWAPINPANTHIIHHGGHFLALCEIGLPYAMTSELETIGRFDFAGRLKTNMTAHPRLDPETGDLHFFAYGPKPPFVHYHRADAAGALVRTEVIDVRGPTIMHDFITTKRYAVFFDLPLLFAPPAGPPGGLPFAWNPEYGARIGLYPLESGGRTRWFDIEPCYVLHFLNAFDDGEAVVVRGVTRDISYVLGTRAPNEGSIVLQEWRIDLASGRVSTAILSDRRADFPRMDERRLGRPHRYGYGVEVPGGSDWAVRGDLFKYDLSTGAVIAHAFGPRAKASEPVFVPAAHDAGEDEGWVMSFVYDDVKDTSFVAVLDAQAFAGPLVARIPLPQRVPYGAHGSWIDGRVL